MDFNYLYHRQQISLMLAARAACGPSRAAHQELARLYTGAIRDKRAGLSLPVQNAHPSGMVPA